MAYTNYKTKQEFIESMDRIFTFLEVDPTHSEFQELQATILHAMVTTEYSTSELLQDKIARYFDLLSCADCQFSTFFSHSQFQFQADSGDDDISIASYHQQYLTVTYPVLMMRPELEFIPSKATDSSNNKVGAGGVSYRYNRRVVNYSKYVIQNCTVKYKTAIVNRLAHKCCWRVFGEVGGKLSPSCVVLQKKKFQLLQNVTALTFFIDSCFRPDPHADWVIEPREKL